MRFPTLPTLLLFLLSEASGSDVRVEYNRDIRPILSDRCYYCHGPDEDERKADLRLDTPEGAFGDLGGYAAIVPGKPDESELFARIDTHDEDEVMPPPKAKKQKVTDEEVALIQRWIEEGAEYQGHWAFEPIRNPAVPGSDSGNPIDGFVRARLEREGIEPSPPAEKNVLIRRATLDLIGLLPTPEEVERFVGDDDPAAFENLVDRLLASEHYGERWGRHWLDGARYADSHGYAIDSERTMWPYRDWVIKAFNDDMPFDQFTTEQLAGDLLPGAEKSALIASAFHRNTLINQEGGSDPEQFRVEATMDRVNTTGAVWLGLTLACAQCHTHKFDPIQHEEYYQMYSFFNTAADRNNAGPTVPVSEGEVFGEPSTGGWEPLAVSSAETASSATLAPQDDGSFLLSDDAQPNESYRVVASSSLDRIGAFRLRVLTDRRLPQNGPGFAENGNFILTRTKVFIGDEEVPLAAAFADHEQEGYPAAAAIDGDPQTGWAINTKDGDRATMNAPHELVLSLAKPLETAGKKIEVRMFHDRNSGYLIGRFALDASREAPPEPAPGEWEKAPEPVSLMVMGEMEKPRDTYLLTRGDFTRPDEARGTLHPGVLNAIAPELPPGDPASRTRLDLARWLVSEENPLTARVTVNRIWMRYFGTGIVETEEDFGTQGSLPSHPDLLDYLAYRFIREGWSMKKLHRLIVTSDTYRQSSNSRPDLAVKDPRNRLLARQSRVRLEAEIIRDAALCASGVLTDEIGGPSIYPPQPKGIYSFTQTKKNWRTSTGPDRYRRGMYIFFYRSAPYPLFGTFDAPDFQATCTRRARSNTPLQALNIANDPAFLELASEMAARLIEEVPGDPETQLEPRLTRAFALTLGRSPSPRESEVLLGYTRSAISDFRSDPRSAESLVGKRLAATGTPPAHAAALVAAARTLFNTDNFITRE